MRTFEGPVDGSNQITEWYWPNRDKVPEHLRARFDDIVRSRSAVDLLVGVAETAYANREARGFPAELLELSAAAAVVAEDHGFHGQDQGSRGSKISRVMRRDSGERAAAGRPWPKKEDDPAPDAARVVQEEAEAPAGEA